MFGKNNEERKKSDEPRNPDGERHCDFIEKHKGIGKLAELCWCFGMRPEELKQYLINLMKDY